MVPLTGSTCLFRILKNRKIIFIVQICVNFIVRKVLTDFDRKLHLDVDFGGKCKHMKYI